jgi:hypothetical protein
MPGDRHPLLEDDISDEQPDSCGMTTPNNIGNVRRELGWRRFGIKNSSG